MRLFVTIGLLICLTILADGQGDYRQFLDDFNRQALPLSGAVDRTQFFYETNVTPETEMTQEKAKVAYTAFRSEQAELAKRFNLTDIVNPVDRRQMMLIQKVGIKLDGTDAAAFNMVISEMKNLFTTPIPAWNSTTGEPDDSQPAWNLTPEMEERLAESRNSDELLYIWNEFRKTTPSIKNLYQDYVRLGNKGASADGFKDMGDYWRSAYETPDLEEQMERAWMGLVPLYEQLHAYVRRKLLEQYPSLFTTSAIPAHLLGNMWAQTWENIFDFTAPYQGIPSIDVSKKMQELNYTGEKLYRISNDFFKDLGLMSMPERFFQDSLFEKPNDREVICHATAYDFMVENEVRIKQCSVITQSDLVTAHHEMGHTEYFLQYGRHPVVFRTGANPGFHEAVGDTLALAVSTPAHLKKIKLLPDNFTENAQIDINYLYRQALDKIAFLPFGYLIDAYRWRIFDDSIEAAKWNSNWWDMRFQYQGLVSPNVRPENAFDAGAKFHVPADVPYIRYFVSFISQFQFYKAMCEAAGHTGPLYKCDFDGNLVAGRKLGDMLQLGYSVPWNQAMWQMTNQPNIDSGPLVEYFQPLLDYLKTENAAAGECFGWGYDYSTEQLGDVVLPTPRCGKILTPTQPPTTTPGAATSVVIGNVLMVAAAFVLYVFR